MATDTRWEPNTLPTTVGMTEKKPPLATPLMMTKMASAASDVDVGQMTSMVKALSAKHRNRVFKAPILSQNNPQRTRPTAEAKLNPASRPAPVDDESPTDRLYRGRKNGGTRSGNVAMAPAAKMIRNLLSRKSDLHEREQCC